jgi:hypothetical protein
MEDTEIPIPPSKDGELESKTVCPSHVSIDSIFRWRIQRFLFLHLKMEAMETRIEQTVLNQFLHLKMEAMETWIGQTVLDSNSSI